MSRRASHLWDWAKQPDASHSAELPADFVAPQAANDDGRGEISRGMIAIIAFFGIFLGWAALAPLDAAVVAPGVIIVSGNRQTVQHRDGGVVSNLAVREGQRVQHGDILIELGVPELVSQERVLLSQVFDLQMQRLRLTADSGGSRTLTRPAEWAALPADEQAIAEEAFTRHQGEARSGGARSEFTARIAGYRDEIVSIDRQRTLVEQELSGMRELADEQLVPLTRVRALERAVAELQGRRAELQAQIAVTQQERSEASRTVDARLAELIPQLAGARARLEQTRIRAPVDGTVMGLTANTVGGVIRPGERVMDIVPDDKELVIQAHVRPEDADDLRVGQVAEVRVTAFGGRDLPIVDGVVRQVSADRFVDEHTGAAYFQAQVAVPPDELERLTSHAGRSIRAGLPAQVVVPTRKRTALQYLFEPLNQALWRSFREG